MQIDRTWTAKLKGDYKDVTSTDNRRLIISDTKISKSNLVNYLKAFHEKQILVKNEQGGTEVNPFFMVEPKDGIVEFNLILDCYE